MHHAHSPVSSSRQMPSVAWKLSTVSSTANELASDVHAGMDEVVASAT